MKVVLYGNGKMGQLIAEMMQKRGDLLIAAFSRSSPPSAELVRQADVCIDFSHPSKTLSHLKLSLEADKPHLIGTTGWESYLKEAQALVKTTQGTALYSPNFSLGVALYYSLLAKAVELFSSFPLYDPTGIEYHHKEKVDAPSGTAKQISTLFKKKLSFTSVRCGSMSGTHTVLWDSPVDTVTITHAAKNREGLAQGALLAAEWIIDKKGWWTFDDMVGTLYTSNHPL